MIANCKVNTANCKVIRSRQAPMRMLETRWMSADRETQWCVGPRLADT